MNRNVTVKCFVIIEGGYQWVCMPDGTKLPGIIETTIVDSCKDPAYAIVTLLVDLKP